MSDSEQADSADQQRSVTARGHDMSRGTVLYAHTTPAAPYRGSKRKRTLSRRVRRFESAVSGLELSARLAGARHTVAPFRGTGWQVSKALTGVILLVVIATLFWLHSEDTWFIYQEDVQFQDLTYLEEEELFEQIRVDGWNAFWLKPGVIRERLIQNPYIAEANVQIKLPATVQVSVEEIQPVAIWITAADAHWLAPNGITLPVDKSPDESLPKIIDSQLEARALGTSSGLAMDSQVLASALALMEALPNLDNAVRYNRSVGLNFPLPEHSVWVYWGDGDYMQEKLANLQAVSKVVSSEETEAQIIDVRYVNQPYFR